MMSVTRALHRGPLSAAPNVPAAGTAVAAPSPAATITRADLSRTDLTGLVVGQYELGKKIGAGGMGCVFAARHTRLDRSVAIKFIAADVAELLEAADRFNQETLALGKLQHPNIVNAIDAGCVNGLQYLVMEYVDGVALDELVNRRGPLPVREACDLIRQTANGLAYSHQHGFLHRDIKPSNLILDHSGVVNILDFGLVRNASADAGYTASGTMLGTFDFVAPEQAHDASTADARSDLYSLGCTFIFLLSGRPPFTGSRYPGAAAKLKGHLFDQPEWLSHPPNAIPAELVAVLRRMVAKSPADRFSSAEQVVDALSPWVADAVARQNPSAGLASSVPRGLPRSRILWLSLTSVVVATAVLMVTTADGLLSDAESGRSARSNSDPLAVRAPVSPLPELNAPVPDPNQLSSVLDAIP